jgi:hypothetical protein
MQALYEAGFSQFTQVPKISNASSTQPNANFTVRSFNPGAERLYTPIP